MKAPAVKIERGHRRGCYAVNSVAAGTWDTPWCLGEHVFRSAWGTETRRSVRSWLRFRCNCTDCPAALLIREDMVLLHFQLRGGGR